MPTQPWLTSDAARAIGPVQRVHGPSGQVYGDYLFVAAVLSLPLCIFPSLLLPIALLGAPRWGGAILPGLFVVSVGVLVFATVLGAVLRGVARSARRDLAGRLLVGARGLALWTPDGETVVPWDDLGTVWMCQPVAHDPSGLAVRRADGAVVVIDRGVEDHGWVVGRILAEWTARLGRRALPRGLRGPSDAIRPDEPGVAETP